MYLFSMIFKCGTRFSSPQQRENVQIADLQLCTFQRDFFSQHAASGGILLCTALQVPMGWRSAATSDQMGRVLSTPVFCKWVRWDDHAGGWKPVVHFVPRMRLLWYYTIGAVGEHSWAQWVAQWKVHHPILSLFFVEKKTAEDMHQSWQLWRKHAAVNAVPSKHLLRLSCTLACVQGAGHVGVQRTCCLYSFYNPYANHSEGCIRSKGSKRQNDKSKGSYIGAEIITAIDQRRINM